MRVLAWGAHETRDLGRFIQRLLLLCEDSIQILSHREVGEAEDFEHPRPAGHLYVLLGRFDEHPNMHTKVEFMNG